MRARSRRRFRVEEAVLASDPIELEGPVLRHLKVLRARPGDHVFLFDGSGEEIEAELREISRERAVAMPLRRVEAEVESELDCWLLQALPARLSRMDDIVRQVTELGVRRIVPLAAERSQTGSSHQRALIKGAERWRRVAAAAAEQCQRRNVPAIDDPCSFAELPWQEMPRPLLLLDPGAPVGSLREALKGGRPPGVAVMVGPEGGWAESEVERAKREGAMVVGLGPRVLRTDTAGVAVLVVLQHRWADLG